MAKVLKYDYPVVNQIVAGIESENGHYEEADKLLSEAIEETPQNASLYDSKSKNNILRGHYDQAIEEAANAIKIAEPKGSI